MNIEIKNNKFVINNQETSNPELIGLAFLDLLEKNEAKGLLDKFKAILVKAVLMIKY